VCPASIKITDNAIIPLKERVVDRSYDPLVRMWRAIRGGSSAEDGGSGADGAPA
jgi:succinate dehydrogenase / fumarate reductase iron-sulfur subunit